MIEDYDYDYYNYDDKDYEDIYKLKKMVEAANNSKDLEKSKTVKITKSRKKSIESPMETYKKIIDSFEAQNIIIDYLKQNFDATRFTSKKALRDGLLKTDISNETLYDEAFNKLLINNILEENKDKKNIKLSQRKYSILDQILEVNQYYPHIPFSDISANMALYIQYMLSEKLDFSKYSEVMYTCSSNPPKSKKLFEKRMQHEASALLLMFYMCEQTNTYQSVLEEAILYYDHTREKRSLVEINEEEPKNFFNEILLRAENPDFKELHEAYSFYKKFLANLPNYNASKNQRNLSKIIPSYYKICQGLQNMDMHKNSTYEEFFEYVDKYYYSESIKEKQDIIKQIEFMIFQIHKIATKHAIEIVNNIYWEIHNDFDYIKHSGLELEDTKASKSSEHSSAEYKKLHAELKKVEEQLQKKTDSEKELKTSNDSRIKEIKELKNRLNNLQAEKDNSISTLENEIQRLSEISLTKIEAIQTGEIEVPEITIAWKNLGELIPGAKPEKMKIRVFTNEKGEILTHKDCAFIPEIDENRIVSIQDIASLFIAWEKKHNSYIWGPTGAGKSTLVEYACALTGRPMIRVNMDSGIDRLHFVGKDTIKSDGTKTWTEFQDGVLLQAMKMPSILLVDEIDFAQPDVLYVLQRVLEGKGLLLMEEGNRFIPAHEEFRLVATANTNGQGDHLAVYRGAKELSIATLDRFATMIKADYLSVKEEQDLLMKQIKGLSKQDAEKIAKLAHEIRVSFIQGELLITLSPRQTMAIADLTVCYSDLKTALKQTLMDRLTPEMHDIVAGLCQRTTGIRFR